MTRDDPRACYSPWLLGLFKAYVRRYVKRHFSGLRLARASAKVHRDRPVVLYSNHASWWDPLVLMLLADRVFPDRRLYGPMAADALERYPWLRRFGAFGVHGGSISSTRRFLALGSELLSVNDTLLAITAQGRFADARERPVTLAPGIAALLSRHPEAQAVPVAIEYPFWNERHPEILVRVGAPCAADRRPRHHLQAALERALTRELEALASDAMRRDPSPFRTLLAGRARGVGFWQDLPLRMRAWRSGRRFDPSHAALERRPSS